MSQPNKRQKTGPGAGLIDLAGGSESIDLTAESAEPLVINLCDDDPLDTSDVEGAKPNEGRSRRSLVSADPEMPCIL